MPQTIQEIEDEIVEEFDQYEDQMDKYEYIIEQGRLLPALPEEYKTDDFMVKGCQSKVWLRAYMEGNVMRIQVDSNTAITKGIAALLWRVLSGQKPGDIVNAKLDFIDRTSLRSHLSSQRSNGLSAMIVKIRNYAAMFDVQPPKED
ncbi:MAG: Fe-S metabolism protein SufE [Bacteroidetes bacterium]|nr:Fe-S metabolism protein SufE [Bacteroidota bacterium]